MPLRHGNPQGEQKNNEVKGVKNYLFVSRENKRIKPVNQSNKFR